MSANVIRSTQESIRHWSLAGWKSASTNTLLPQSRGWRCKGSADEVAESAPESVS
jgi:hypothetical protein